MRSVPARRTGTRRDAVLGPVVPVPTWRLPSNPTRLCHPAPAPAERVTKATPAPGTQTKTKADGEESVAPQNQAILNPCHAALSAPAAWLEPSVPPFKSLEHGCYSQAKQR